MPRSVAATLPARKRQAHRVLEALATEYPKAVCALDSRTPFELLVATVLSAQCTDRRVNLVTPALFAACPTPLAMAEAPVEQLAELVRSTGFFNSKSRHLKALAGLLVTRFGGEVPRTLAELTALPGVARKTASVVLGVCFGLAEGVVCDTHVMRVAGRLGLTTRFDAKGIEQDLMLLLPQAAWISFSHRAIAHGRALCLARRPRCGECPLLPCCPTAKAAAKAAAPARRRTAT